MPRALPPAWIVRPAVRARNALGRLHGQASLPFATILERTFGLLENKALAVAAELRVADLLHGRPRTATDLAAEAGCDAGALDRLLAYLVTRGFFSRDRAGRYRNTRLSGVLRSDHPDSMRDWVLFFGSDWNWRSFATLSDAVRTGSSAARHAFGTSFWDQITRVDPDAGRLFNAAMRNTSTNHAPVVAQGYDFSGVRHLCDVGGGIGTLAAAIVNEHPRMRATVLDLPELEADAAAYLRERGVADRCTFVGGSFFETVPPDADAYLLQAIVHDWSDDACLRILGNVRDAMPPDGRVLVIELPLDPPADVLARAVDVVMLAHGEGGRERTLPEYRTLFDRAGLRLRRDVTLPSLFHVFELRRR